MAKLTNFITDLLLTELISFDYHVALQEKKSMGAVNLSGMKPAVKPSEEPEEEPDQDGEVDVTKAADNDSDNTDVMPTRQQARKNIRKAGDSIVKTSEYFYKPAKTSILGQSVEFPPTYKVFNHAVFSFLEKIDVVYRYLSQALRPNIKEGDWSYKPDVFELQQEYLAEVQQLRQNYNTGAEFLFSNVNQNFKQKKVLHPDTGFPGRFVSDYEGIIPTLDKYEDSIGANHNEANKSYAILEHLINDISNTPQWKQLGRPDPLQTLKEEYVYLHRAYVGLLDILSTAQESNIKNIINEKLLQRLDSFPTFVTSINFLSPDPNKEFIHAEYQSNGIGVFLDNQYMSKDFDIVDKPNPSKTTSKAAKNNPFDDKQITIDPSETETPENKEGQI